MAHVRFEMIDTKTKASRHCGIESLSVLAVEKRQNILLL